MPVPLRSARRQRHFLHPWLVAACLLTPLLGQSAKAQYFSLGKGGSPLEFYDIDYSYLADPAKRTGPLDALHYIGLGGDAYLSLGGEFREQAWAQNNEAYALRTPTRNAYDLQRELVDFYLHIDRHLAIFAQVGRFDSFGKINPSTTDRDYGRLQQGFVELKEPAGPAQVTARIGRQEIALGSARFVWVNDSSNVRTTHDAVRIHSDVQNNVALDFIYSRPVVSQLQAFSDFDTHNGVFGAVYASEALIPNIFHVDEYYFYRRNLGAQYLKLTGNEDRDTLGGRFWGDYGPFKFDTDFAYQFGTFNGAPISAFGTSTRVLYTFERVVWQPGLQFQGSYFSGSGGGKTIGTFSAPFPRPTLLNYIGLNTLENVIEAYPALVLNPTSNFAFRLGPEVLWRASVNDAVYISRATPLTATLSANDKASYIGTNLIATAQWRPVSTVTVFGEYLHQLAGPAITLAGGRPADAGVIQVDFNF
ncbi:alginate export family protein [uncultured Methylovirgula sp.]|uniref:alginate export family protein n=1 Tax=uncultured Methylovirgula sp. TaxID=1285960 RepID=UPI00262D4289|nr:alginate export family protein [uncultured Methylovirgula sp.]